jgi:DNA polymerase-3 subunit beta
MAIFVDSLSKETGYESRLILPRKAVQELSRLLDDGETDVELYYSDNQIKVLYKNVVFSSKLIDAKFPDFGRVFDQDFLEPIVVQRQLLRETLTRVVVLANEKFKGVSFEITTDVLKIHAHNPEHDEADEEIELHYQGNPVKIAFNAQYILDAISNTDSDGVALILSSNLSSCFIQEPTQSSYRFIVMPMRL